MQSRGFTANDGLVLHMLLVNDSLLSDYFLTVFKYTVIKPLLQKSPLDLKNYHPVSDLSFMSKVINKLKKGSAAPFHQLEFSLPACLPSMSQHCDSSIQND